MIVEVIVHSVAALVTAHLRCRNRTEIAEVIVAEHQGYAVKLRIAHKAWRLLIAVEIRLNFLIKSEHSRYFIKVLVYVFSDELILSLQHLAQQVDIVLERCILAHDRGIGFAAHTDGDDIFELAASLEAVFPESRDAFLVLKEVPGITVDRLGTS